MATAPITRDDLCARFPEMSDVPSWVADAVIEEVVERIGDHWPENMRARAQLYLAAHILAVEGGTERSVDNATLGPVSGRSEGGLSEQYAATSRMQSGDDYSDTPYGRRFSELKRAAFGGAVFSV